MSNNEPSAPSKETRHSSCPYPLTPGQFPVPSASENVASASESRRNDTGRLNDNTIPVGMLSPYFKDQILPQENFPLTGLADDGTEIINFQHHSNPTAPLIEDTSADEQIPIPLPIGFKTVDVQMESVPSQPPPSYNELFVPKDADRPATVDTGTSMNTITTTIPRNRNTANRSEIESSREPRTIVVPRNNNARTIVYQNRPDNGSTFVKECAITITLILILILMVSIYYFVRRGRAF